MRTNEQFEKALETIADKAKLLPKLDWQQCRKFGIDPKYYDDYRKVIHESKTDMIRLAVGLLAHRLNNTDDKQLRIE